ncbi:MAG: RICIN domain-containing protein [Fimbriiglobus sp.]
MRYILLAVVPGLIAPNAAGQPSPERLDAAKTVFTAGVEKLNAEMFASFDRATKAAQDPAVAQKLAAERERFEKHRIPPTQLPVKDYLRTRNQLVQVLESAYAPQIASLRGMQSVSDAEELEGELHGLLISARGFGPAMLDPDAGKSFRIENARSGLVVDVQDPDADTSPVTLTKSSGNRPAQVWQLERSGHVLLVKNVSTGKYLRAADRAAGADGEVGVGPAPKPETLPVYQWELVENRRHVSLRNVSNNFVLTPAKVKAGGGSVTRLTLAGHNNQDAIQSWTFAVSGK